jgi:hypothetical protein
MWRLASGVVKLTYTGKIHYDVRGWEGSERLRCEQFEEDETNDGEGSHQQLGRASPS